jgi:hypothetical protein
VAQNAGVTGKSRWTDQVSLGVLASSVPRDVIDDAVAAAGRQARRSDGKLPPHVMVYFAMAMVLFADEDYEEVAARLAGTLGSWGCWDTRWGPPTSGGITRARERLGFEPLAGIFARVAVPVADPLTRGALLGPWRLMSIDGFEWDAPDTPGNAAAFGYAGSGKDRSAFPKVRVVSISECGSHAVVDAETGPIAGKGSGEQSLARKLCRRLGDDWLLIAGRNFYGWEDWRAAVASGAALLWRVKPDLALPVLEILPDGSYRSVLVSPRAGSKARQALISAARAGEDLEEDKAAAVRVIEYEVPDRDGDGWDLVALARELRTEYGIGISVAPWMPAGRVDATDGVPVGDCRVRVVDPVSRAPLPAGETGALEISGPGLFLGYLGRPDATAAEIVDDWFHTWDLASIAEDGYVTLAGRTKDIIIRGGLNIPVAAVENLLHQHPDVLDAAVIGLPDPRLGERACAVLVTAEGRHLSLPDVTGFLLAEGLSRHFLPERVELVDALPKTMSGKIRKAELRGRFGGDPARVANG